MSSKKNIQKPQSVEIHLGKKLRAHRKKLKLTQLQVAEMLGITSQQVCKYEKGLDRIPASRLLELSKALSLPLTSFYEGLDGYKEQEKEVTVTCTNKEGKKFTVKLLDEEGVISDLKILEK